MVLEKMIPFRNFPCCRQTFGFSPVFDNVSWVTRKASCLQQPMLIIPEGIVLEKVKEDNQGSNLLIHVHLKNVYGIKVSDVFLLGTDV